SRYRAFRARASSNGPGNSRTRSGGKGRIGALAFSAEGTRSASSNAFAAPLPIHKPVPSEVAAAMKPRRVRVESALFTARKLRRLAAVVKFHDFSSWLRRPGRKVVPGIFSRTLLPLVARLFPESGKETPWVGRIFGPSFSWNKG